MGAMTILCRLGLHRWTPWQVFNTLSNDRHCERCKRRQARSMRHAYPAVAVPGVGWRRSPLEPIHEVQPDHLAR
jgi:hypothetical protein